MTYKPTELPDVEVRGFKQLFGSMPYGAMAHFIEVVDAADVATNLDKLREVLESVAIQDTENAGELAKLRADIEAVRRVFGS